MSLAVDKVIEKAKRSAAELLEAAVVDVTFDAGRFTIAGTDRSVGLAEVAHAASVDGNDLVESGEFSPTMVTFPNGTHICEVEIDPDTGVTEVVRYSAVEGARLRAEPDAGGGSDAWRRGAGRRPGDG